MPARRSRQRIMANNEGVVFLGPGKVQVQSIDYPKFQNPSGKPIQHGVILKIVSSNICGSDQHMVRGRTTAPVGMVLGHEIAAKILDLTMPAGILPMGFHGAVTAGDSVGATVYVEGAGTVGLAAAASAQILGAAVDMIGDMNKQRLEPAKRVCFEPIYLSSHDRLEELIADVVGVPEVDSAIDCVGFEARAYGAAHGKEAPAIVLNSLMSITRAAPSIGIPELYVTENPRPTDQAPQLGHFRLRLGLAWAKSHRFATVQTPVLRYNRQLIQAILHDRLPIATIVHATVIRLKDAPKGYQDFDSGVAKKFVLDPNGMIAKAA